MQHTIQCDVMTIRLT